MSLVLCSCFHPVDDHDVGGCKGDRFRRCGCRLWPGEALEAAIDAVRSTYGRRSEKRADDSAMRADDARSA